MPDRTCITMSFPAPLFFRYHLPLRIYVHILQHISSWPLLGSPPTADGKPFGSEASGPQALFCRTKNEFKSKTTILWAFYRVLTPTPSLPQGAPEAGIVFN